MGKSNHGTHSMVRQKFEIKKCFIFLNFFYKNRVSDEKDARSYLQALASKMNEELGKKN
jgi:hypothetical protein